MIKFIARLLQQNNVWTEWRNSLYLSTHGYGGRKLNEQLQGNI